MAPETRALCASACGKEEFDRVQVRVDDGLAPDVKARVDDHGRAQRVAKREQERVDPGLVGR